MSLAPASSVQGTITFLAGYSVARRRFEGLGDTVFPADTRKYPEKDAPSTGTRKKQRNLPHERHYPALAATALAALASSAVKK